MSRFSNKSIDTEEAKRILDSDAIVATNLTITGELPDGSSFVQQYDELHKGETISFVVPVDLNNLTSGVDAILLKNIRLDYTDENNNARIKTPDKITLPVIGSDGKITNQVSTDKATYYEHENVSIFDRIHNNSDIRAAKGLTNVISIIDSEGNVIKEFSKPLSEIMTKSYVEVSEIWNVAEQSEGQYTIISNVYDGEVLVAESQAMIEVVHHGLPQYELTGELVSCTQNLRWFLMIEIETYLKIKGDFINIKETTLIDKEKNSIDIDYLEGAIVIKYWSTVVIGLKEWDYVDQLWNYYIMAISECIKTGESSFSFPDQSLIVSIRRYHNDSCMFSVISETEERKYYFNSFIDLAQEMLNSYLYFYKIIGTILNYSNNMIQECQSVIKEFISRW